MNLAQTTSNTIETDSDISKSLVKKPIKKVLIKKDFFFEITQIQQSYEINLKALSELKNVEMSLLEERFKKMCETINTKEKLDAEIVQKFILKILEQEPKALQNIAIIANSYDLRLHNNVLEQLLNI